MDLDDKLCHLENFKVNVVHKFWGNVINTFWIKCVHLKAWIQLY